MSPVASYRFLPWSRRGLAAEIQQPDPLSAPLPSGRGAIRVAVAINHNPAIAAPPIATYGPGDVIGLDTRVIVRTEPQRYTPDFEPNYLAAIDFDPPDFPWMLTPAAPNVAGGVHKIRPWLVLLVCDRARVAPPSMQRGRPLPTVTISAEAAPEELPDLSESWAWAHVQVSMAQGAGEPLADHLGKHPNLNVSRLICPRRLVPMHQYVACLVPAFNQGVVRGLGGAPDPAQPLDAAWSSANPADIELPVYFHWEFSTGPGGDFEELARRLRPVVPPATIGYQKVYLNPSELEVNGLGAADAGAYTWIEGALRAPVAGGAVPAAGEPGAPLATIPQPILDRLRERLNEPVALAAGLSAGAAQPIGPPIYGSWPSNEHSLGQTSAGWLRELNLDPRFRAAAGLGAEVVRQNQEDFMQACWEQVDEVLKANELLGRARLAREIGQRLIERFFQVRPAAHLAAVLAPLHTRILYRQVTLDLAIRRSSLPDRVFDPALRRLISPQRAVIKHALRRAGLASSPGPGFVATVNTQQPDADPTVFTPDGVAGSRAVSRVTADGGRSLDFAAVGLRATLDAAATSQLVRSARGAAAAIKRGFTPIDLGEGIDRGVVLDAHTRQAAALADAGLALGQVVAIGAVMSTVRTAGGDDTAAALLIAIEGGKPALGRMFVEPDGNVMLERQAGERRVVAQLAPNLRGLSRADAGELLVSLEPGAIVAKGRRTKVPIIDRPVPGGIIRAAARAAAPPPVTNTFLPPIAERETVERYKVAFARYRDDAGLTVAPPSPAFVPMAMDDVRGVLLAATDPHVTIRARIGTMVSIQGRRFTDAGSGTMVSQAEDRIMIGPKIAAPMYEYLASFDGERFLPGVGQVAQNSILMLATNPRFVEAFMVGMSHEMNRELLWRGYPTDQRGTIFQRFWAWADAGQDIPEIHTWPRARALGATARQLAGGSQIVMLVRGELLRRYPGTVVLLWPGEQREGRLQLKAAPAPGEVLTPVFGGRFAPDFTFFGFPLTPADVAAGNWFFVLQEQPVEPRFGFDTPASDQAAGLASWLDATWDDVATAEGAYLRLAGNPAAGQTLGGVTFGRDASHLAAVLLQRPFRAALEAKKLLARMV